MCRYEHREPYRLDVRKRWIRRVAIVYAWPVGHRHPFARTRRDDELMFFVQRYLWPGYSNGLFDAITPGSPSVL